ncbi:MAG: hypothetical protein GOMPHAMPRED_001014 [Gomphillus americanus]|uniref:Kinesin motor domain-containing protein n=1 Tax=Gomphillus americanus TaxID=1940652 RepID=A0A8H3I698_9LECA|nr:MAG: hypothetical protein GOMPHAMPRED_001014 [Gomphillus americanus]
MRPAAKRAPSGAQARNVRAGSARPATSRQASALLQATRQNTAIPSPMDSIDSKARSPVAGIKRKERDFELEGEETNINVVVRCRGRNDREVLENSGVVVSTEGARGKTVDLSMGPNALSNKTYHFDKVFSPAADQSMVYDDVVAPILDEMIGGYNCTVFAYGQTGTGKTYTMSGDMTDTLGLLSDAAGIIPRALYSLFGKLEANETENTVKISFIELYNEELRDLLASDDSTKLKLYEADQKKGQGATFVQGMEESYIRSAQEGVRLLQEGSHKRQVAATKCNDLSSRSHTVFTITVYTKRTGETDEDWVVSGKLNLVDLAGSENIQRSGAENKRAAEAGLINKSLLTLGRVINALVDKGPHIPYRESKLTRLLQDSLGGRTKTCIIATISPARSNLEETISTLDYAFRAKNIRNKPQINQPVTKKTLLREYTAEIQQLKSELIATRQRNGVYLSNDHYEQITVESESRRILSEEQRAKIETMETNLRNKVQDLFNLTNNLAILKKDHVTTSQQLDDTNDVLRQTEIVLAETKRNLDEENTLRKAHEATEEELSKQGATLISALDKTVEDVSGLRAKIRRKSDLQTLNRTHWQTSQMEVSDVTKLVEGRVNGFKTTHRQLVDDFSVRFQAFLGTELGAIEKQEMSLTAAGGAFKANQKAITQQSAQAQTEMDCVLEEIKTLREDVESKVEAGLHDLCTKAGRISTGVIEKLGMFQKQLDDSYHSLGKDMKSIFDDLNRRLKSQELEAESLRQQLMAATQAAQEANGRLAARMEKSLQEEKDQAALDRKSLISQITDLVNANGAAQDQRVTDRMNDLQEEVQNAKVEIQSTAEQCDSSIRNWLQEEATLNDYIANSRDIVKGKLQTDWESIEKHESAIEASTKSIHKQTVEIVETQIRDMTSQMQALDESVIRAKSHNKSYCVSNNDLVEKMADSIMEAHGLVADAVSTSKDAIRSLKDYLTSYKSSTTELSADLAVSVQQPLSELRNSITSTALAEYTVTGITPQKTTYTYPRVLASTASHATILGKKLPQEEDPLVLPIPDLLESITPPSPTKTDIYTDTDLPTEISSTLLPKPSSTSDSLREVPVNVCVSDRESKTENLSKSLNLGLSRSLMGPPLKRGVSNDSKPVNKLAKTVQARVFADGRENALPTASGGGRFSASVGSEGRRLRSSVRQE